MPTLDIQPPRQLNPVIPNDLEQVCLKLLEKNPSGRYSSAAALADALKTAAGQERGERADLRAKLTRAQELHARDETKEAIKLIEEAYHAARSHGLKAEQLEATLNLAFATSERQDFKAVERRLREAKKLICDVTSPWHHIQYCRLKARVLRHQKYTAPAEKALQKALSFSASGEEDVEDVRSLARADYIHLLSELGRASEADEHVGRLRQTIAKAGERSETALISELLKACMHWAAAKSDIEEVGAFLKVAFKYGEGREAAVCLGHALHDCANGARGMKASEVALRCADAAERLGQVAHRPDMAFAAAYTAAAVLADKEDFHAVHERCLQLLDSARTLAEPKLRFCLFHLLSLASRQLGDNTTAVGAAETALKDSEGDPIGLCMARMALAEALRDCGRVKEAMEHGRTAMTLSEHADVPREYLDDLHALLAECAALLGEWAIAERYAKALGESASPHSSGRRKLIENRIRMHKMIRKSLTSVIQATDPLSLARTSNAGSVQAANAMLMDGIIDGWKEYPNAASAMYDYWGRGNLLRAMLNMRAFSAAFNMTLEVHTVEEARRAVRLWGLIADVLVLIWKGPTVSHSVYCPVPWSFSNAGGGGYFVAVFKGVPCVRSEVTGMDMWKEDTSADAKTAIIGATNASLLPPEVGRFLSEEALRFVAAGRLIVVPATGIGCVGSGHGPVEEVFAEACNAFPAIRGDAARCPASWLPYFPDIPLDALAHVVEDYDAPLRRLRLLLVRRTREFRGTSITGSEARELELEIHDSIAQIADTQQSLRNKHGWREAREAVASRYDGFTEDHCAPILVLQNMGYRWRIAQSIEGATPEPVVLPKENEPICSWLQPPDTRPKHLTNDDLQAALRSRKASRRRMK